MNPQFLKGVKSLNDASKALQKVLTDGQDLVNKYTFEKLTTLGEDIKNQQELLTQLSQEYAEKKRQAEVSLKLDIQEMEKEACAKWASKASMSFITNERYNELVNAQASIDSTIANKVAEIEKSANASKGAAINTIKLQHEAATATLNAQLTSAQDKIVFLESQNDTLRVQLAKASDDAVKIAQSNSATVNVENKK